MNNFCYPFVVTKGKKTSTFIWFSNDKKDVFLKTGKGDLYKADQNKDIDVYINGESVHVKWEEAAQIDFDEVFFKLDELKSGFSSDADSCNILLSAFNFFEDFQRTYKDDPSISVLSAYTLDTVYDKLFWGNNIEALKPKNESFAPIWSEEEILDLKNYIHDAFGLFYQKSQMS